MKFRTPIITAALASLFAGGVGASLFLVPSNIDPVQKYSWSENAGWMNWADANGGADGVFVDTDFLSGFVWIENAGWVNVGNGGGPYANTDDANFGVNILGGGNLAGYGWGENIGWINFDTSSKAPNQARFDGTRFRGYAWAENIGWINLDDATSFVATTLPLDPPTTGDDVCVGGGNNGLPCSEDASCPGGVCRLKNRFITALIPATATAHGVKVKLGNLDANSVATPANYDGTDRWAGVPLIGVNDGISPPFNAARLQCAFASQDWSAIGQLHLYGDVVVPRSTYQVSVCTAAGGPCSAGLNIGTARFGDVVLPTPTVNFQDVNSIVAKFQGAPSGPSKTRTKLTNSIVNPANPINFQEVSACVSAFQSKAFKTVVPAPPVICP